MHNCRQFLLTGMLVFLTSVPVMAQEGPPIAWDSDYARIRNHAKACNRPILLSFGTSSCGWCTKLHATTFRDPRVAEILDREFVTGKINAEEYPALVRTLRISAYPTLVIAAPNGRIIRVIEGYQSTPQMLAVLDSVRQQFTTQSAELILTSGSQPPQ
jgi:uncharacterized protein YyaL (SSP411 family)